MELPDVVSELVTAWSLELAGPYQPGGQCAWVAPARTSDGEEVVLKVGWRHPEAEGEPDALRLWNGAGAVLCHGARAFGQTHALLLERCVPGSQLKQRPEREQDEVIAGLLRRLWAISPGAGHPLGSLSSMCEDWADQTEIDLEDAPPGVDHGLVRAGLDLLRELSGAGGSRVLLCTDLHAENVLASTREPWLVIDPKPHVGDPAYAVIQHLLNCDERLASDPIGLARRMAELAGLDASACGCAS